MQTISLQRQQIRHQIRETRQKLSSAEQIQAEKNITQQALQLIEQTYAQNIALYLSFDNEVSTKSLVEELWKQQKNVYLPVIHPFSVGYLLFLKYQPNTLMVKNKFGILEPQLNIKNILPIEELNIIFTPLVAFDSKGNRLGMGGGFYDRTLQKWQQKSFIPVGLAYACQQVEALPVESWDIPLFSILMG